MTKVLIDSEVVERTIDTLEELYLHTSSHEVDGSFYAVITELRAALEKPDTGIPTSVPDGWKLVPVEPTIKMVSEGSCAAALPGPRYIDESAAKKCWAYMLDAAPQPPVAEQPQLVEMLGETCIDGGKCHHKCTDRCFRRECCAPFSDYSGPWKYEQTQPQGEQEPVAEIQVKNGHWIDTPVAKTTDLADGVHKLYTRPQNLNCKSTQARLATLWGYVKVAQQPKATFDEVWDAIDWGKWRMAPIRELVREIHSKTSPQPPRQPLTDEQKAAVTRELNRARCLEKRVVGNIELTDRIASAIERAHDIGSGS